MQINLTGFLNARNARIFMSELWDLMLTAMDSPSGIPEQFVEKKKHELMKRQEEDDKIRQSLKAREEEISKVLLTNKGKSVMYFSVNLRFIIYRTRYSSEGRESA